MPGTMNGTPKGLVKLADPTGPAPPDLARERPYYRDPDILTTGQVARLLGSCPRTVVRLIRNGLPAYRLPTGGVRGDGDRRVHRSELIAWCRENGIPVRPEFGVVAVVGTPPGFRVPPGWRVLAAADWVELAFRWDGRAAVAWVIDYAAGRADCDKGARLIRQADPAVPVARVLGEDVAAAELGGPTRDFRSPFDPDQLADWLAGQLVRRQA